MYGTAQHPYCPVCRVRVCAVCAFMSLAEQRLTHFHVCSGRGRPPAGGGGDQCRRAGCHRRHRVHAGLPQEAGILLVHSGTCHLCAGIHAGIHALVTWGVGAAPTCFSSIVRSPFSLGPNCTPRRGTWPQYTLPVPDYIHHTCPSAKKLNWSHQDTHTHVHQVLT